MLSSSSELKEAKKENRRDGREAATNTQHGGAGMQPWQQVLKVEGPQSEDSLAYTVSCRLALLCK